VHKIDINTILNGMNVIDSNTDKLKEINGGCDGTCVVQVARCTTGTYYIRKVTNPCLAVKVHETKAIKYAKAENNGNGIARGTYKAYYF